MNGYPSIPLDTLQLRLRWLENPTNPALLVEGIEAWGGALLPSVVGTDAYGPFAQLNLKHRRGERLGEPKTTRLVDPAFLWVLQAHLWFGGGCAIKEAVKGVWHYPDAGPRRIGIIRLIADTTEDFQGREDHQRQFDYRRNALPSPVTVAAARAAGKKSQDAYLGREDAVADSLAYWEKHHGRARLGLTREQYAGLLWAGYALLDRLPLSAQRDEAA